MDENFDISALPKALVRKIIAKSLAEVGLYDGSNHHFRPDGFHPDMTVMAQLTEEAQAYGIAPEDVPELVPLVLSSIRTEPIAERIESLDLTDAKKLPTLSHIRFEEQNDEGIPKGVTDLIYLGNKKFHVLSTNRTTIVPGMVLKAREELLVTGEKWKFDLFKDIPAEKGILPEGAGGFDDTYFITGKVVSVFTVSSPELFTIADGIEEFGGVLQRLVDPESAFGNILKLVKMEVDLLGETPLPDMAPFPHYRTLLGYSKQQGVPAYVLNTVIEKMERRDAVTEKSFTTEDWIFWESPETRRLREEEEYRKNAAAYEGLKKELKEELKKIHRRRVAFFYDAPGVFSKESEKHLKDISIRMDYLALKGFGSSGYAASQIATAKANTLPRPRHNLKVTLILVAILVGLAFIGWSWKTAHDSRARFDERIAAVETMVGEERFTEAKEACLQAKAEFEPGFLRFLVARKTKRTLRFIESSIDEFIANRIEQIKLMIKANRGRIDSYIWGLIVETMELRPDDPELQALREQYINQ